MIYNKSNMQVQSIFFHLLDSVDWMIAIVFKVWKQWLGTKVTTIDISKLIIDQIESSISPIIDTYATDLFIDANEDRLLKSRSRRQRKIHIDKAIKINNFFYLKRTPSLLYMRERHSSALRSKIFDIKKLRLELNAGLVTEVVETGPASPFVARSSRRLKRQWTSQNLFNADMYESEAKFFAFGPSQKDASGEAITSPALFDRQEIIVNLPQDENVEFEERWNPQLIFPHTYSNDKALIAWLILPPKFKSSYPYFTGMSQNTTTKLLNLARNWCKDGNCSSITSLNVWWIHSFYYSSIELAFNSTIMVSLFKFKIKFFDTELIKYTTLIEHLKRKL